MIIAGTYVPNISCLKCGHRHPEAVSCTDAKLFGARAVSAVEWPRLTAPCGCDLNSLVLVCRDVLAKLDDHDAIGVYYKLEEVRKLLALLPPGWPVDQS